MIEKAAFDLIEQNGFFKALVDHMQIGIIVSDANGYIIYINPTYARFLNIDIGASLGKHANDLISNSRLAVVAKTGQAEINYPHKFKDNGFLVQRIPIKRDGLVVAVIGLVLFDSAATVINLAERLAVLESKLQSYQEQLASLHTTCYSFEDIIGDSPPMRKVRAEAVKAATNDLPVLLTGESGTGKELFAHAIHQASARKNYPFVKANCAAIPKDLLEAQLFGYAKGAFTGADPKGRPGKFETAHLGTIFLDEIGDMPLDMQPKMLRVLETKEIERIGSTAAIPVDFRVIAATNQDIGRLMHSGLFRRDLYYRLNVVPLDILPLRKRREDILALAYHFIQKIVKGAQGRGIRIHSSAEKALLDYDWPGNGRELLHVFERLLHGFNGHVINISALPPYLRNAVPAPVSNEKTPLREYLARVEKYAIQAALDDADGSRTKAARALGIHRTLLYRKMKKLAML